MTRTNNWHTPSTMSTPILNSGMATGLPKDLCLSNNARFLSEAVPLAYAGGTWAQRCQYPYTKKHITGNNPQSIGDSSVVCHSAVEVDYREHRQLPEDRLSDSP